MFHKSRINDLAKDFAKYIDERDGSIISGIVERFTFLTDEDHSTSFELRGVAACG